MNVELITIIIGFIGVIIAILQINNNLRIEFREQFKEIKSDNKELKTTISELANKIDKVNSDLSTRIDAINSDLSTRIDAVNSRLDALYRELFRKDAA